MDVKKIGNFTIASISGEPIGVVVRSNRTYGENTYDAVWETSLGNVNSQYVRNEVQGLALLRSVLYPEMEPASQYFKVAHHEYMTGLRDEDASAKHFAAALDQIGIIDVIESGENNEFYMNAPYINGVYVLRTDSGITFRAGSYIFPPDTPCVFMEAQRQEPDAFQVGPVVATAKFEWRRRPAAFETDEIRQSLLKRMREIIRRKHS